MKIARFVGWTLLAFSLSFAVELTPARACTCVAQLRSSLEGALDVPLDVVPIVRGAISSPLTWTAQDGTSVAFDERSGKGPARCPGPDRELRPHSLLTPNTRYTIRAKLNDGSEATIGFTTGTGRTPELILPKPTLVATLVRRGLYDSCNTPVNGCLALGDAETEVTVLDPQGAELNWFVARGELHLETTGEQVACIEARTRNAAGQLSEPVRLCGAELEVHDTFFSDYEDSFLRCIGGRIPSQLAPDAAIPWPKDAGTADAASPSTADAASPSTVPPTAAADARAATTTDLEAASARESDDGCSIAAGEWNGALCGIWAVIAGLRRRRSRS